MIRIFNSAAEGERFIPLDEVDIHLHYVDARGRPYILFEHKDYPLGGLYAWFDGSNWECDLD